MMFLRKWKRNTNTSSNNIDVNYTTMDSLFNMLRPSASNEGYWHKTYVDKNLDLKDIDIKKFQFFYDNKIYSLTSLEELDNPQYQIKSYVFKFSSPVDRLKVTFINDKISSLRQSYNFGPVKDFSSFNSNKNTDVSQMNKYSNKIEGIVNSIYDNFDSKIREYYKEA